MRTPLAQSVFGLLLVTGTLLGATPPLGKAATAAGAPPLLWAFVISFGAGAILLAGLLATGRGLGLTPHKLRFYLLAAIVSYAIPNVLLFSAVPHLGAGYSGIMFTLSPVITLTMSIALGVQPPNRLGIIGIAVGFIGALIVATTRGAAGAPASIGWVVVGLMIPISLAAGNVYRSFDWPADAGPTELAAGSHLASAAIVFAGLFLTGDMASFALLPTIPWITLAQITSAAAMFVFFFRLQEVGGPVYLSQIGYVAAAIGLLAGIFLLGERYAALTWVGALIIAAGVALTTRAQRNAQ
ncbi:DMT family transporter [Pararhizobium haloflavum]|uniref:DMT family transporter n=1 Tax=Pararhizobium haloflavum TaxID=2037914 RepID=UPI000C196319|nr:DMT family transporter [Pararhizobium haloflavum]